MGRFFQTNKPQDIDFIRELPQELMMQNAALEAQKQSILGSGMDLASQFQINTYADPVYQNQVSKKREELSSQMEELVLDMQKNGSSLASRQRANQIANELANWRNTVGDNMERDYTNFGETIRKMEADETFTPNRIAQYKEETLRRLQNNDPTSKNFRMASGANFSGVYDSQTNLRKLVKPDENKLTTLSEEDFSIGLPFQYRNKITTVEGYNKDAIYQASIAHLLNKEEFIQDNLTRYQYNLNNERYTGVDANGNNVLNAAYQNYLNNHIIRDKETGQLKVVERNEPLEDDQSSFIAYKADTEATLYKNSFNTVTPSTKNTDYKDDFGMASALENQKQRNKEKLAKYKHNLENPVSIFDPVSRVSALGKDDIESRFNQTTSGLKSTRANIELEKEKLKVIAGPNNTGTNSQQYVDLKAKIDRLETTEKLYVDQLGQTLNSTLSDLEASTTRLTTDDGKMVSESDRKMAQKAKIEFEKLLKDSEENGVVNVGKFFDLYEKNKLKEVKLNNPTTGTDLDYFNSNVKSSVENKNVYDYLDSKLKSVQNSASTVSIENIFNNTSKKGKLITDAGINLLRSDGSVDEFQRQIDAENDPLGPNFIQSGASDELLGKLQRATDIQSLQVMVANGDKKGITTNVNPYTKTITYSAINKEGKLIEVEQKVSDADIQQIVGYTLNNIENASQEEIQSIVNVFRPHDNTAEHNKALVEAAYSNNNKKGYITQTTFKNTSIPLVYTKDTDDTDRANLSQNVPITGNYYIRSINAYDPNSSNQNYQLEQTTKAVDKAIIYKELKDSFSKTQIISDGVSYGVKYNKEPYTINGKEFQMIELTSNGRKKLFLSENLPEEGESIEEYITTKYKPSTSLEYDDLITLDVLKVN